MEHNYFKTTDGVLLHYAKIGEGPPLIYLPSFLGNTNALNKNYDELQKHFTIYILDYRGHGESETPNQGWKIARLSKDLEELTNLLDLNRFYLLSHSMGCAVAWSYISLFGEDKIQKAIFQDEAPFLLVNPDWSTQEREQYSGKITQTSPWNIINEFGKSREACINALNLLLNANESIDLPDYNKEKYQKLGELLFNHITSDWREEIQQITIPTLYIGGLVSGSTTAKTHKWVHHNMRNNQLVVFDKEEKGTHHMHLTNPTKFNQIVIDYLVK